MVRATATSVKMRVIENRRSQRARRLVSAGVRRHQDEEQRDLDGRHHPVGADGLPPGHRNPEQDRESDERRGR
jgi:hypothetical protein